MNSLLVWILRKTPAWLVVWSHKKIYGKKDILIFQKFLELNDNWQKVQFDCPEKWIFKDDNSFTIEVPSESRDFKEEWTDKFPDKNSKNWR